MAPPAEKIALRWFRTALPGWVAGFSAYHLLLFSFIALSGFCSWFGFYLFFYGENKASLGAGLFVRASAFFCVALLYLSLLWYTWV
jgi:hypothetical protein